MTPDTITARLIRPKYIQEFKERIRSQIQTRDGVVGYAIEIVREIMGQEYQYVGWVSMKLVQTDPVWIADQWAMCDRAFATTMKRIAH